MKKTLITLLALGGMAMGAAPDLANANITTNGTTTSYWTEDGNFTVALTLDVESLRKYLEKGQTPAWGTDIVRYDAGGTATGVCINGGSSNSKVNTSGLYARWGNDTAWNPSNSADVRWDGGTNLSDLNGDAEGTGWDSVGSAGLVYGFGATTGTVVALTILDTDGTALVDSYVTAGNLKSGNATNAVLTLHSEMVAAGYFFDDRLGYVEADYKALAAAAAGAAIPATEGWTRVIPEPATATLSLLALAGLAARRRRR
ncbi:MAG: PEP-CTERM sorting domain-containing protein [Akkermansia sp.]|nr:PEP-CTERM sorting domain-containing protein [Akkermansia sp.]